MKNYNTLFFDLDHTLWDYEKNSIETLTGLHTDYQLYDKMGITLTKFIEIFNHVNEGLWIQYNHGQIDRDYIKEHRFYKILVALCGTPSPLSGTLSYEYIRRCSEKSNLMPNALETLDYLAPKYQMYILTNGFNDVQERKLKNAKLSHYFEGMITSETCGHRKPSRHIFDFTLSQAKANSYTTLMIGDNLQADIVGARSANIGTIYYNPNAKSHNEIVDFEIKCLSELTSLL